jgi:hypothetical protein
MADHEEREDGWGEHTAWKTFLWTVIGVALFLGTVLMFVLSREA